LLAKLEEENRMLKGKVSHLPVRMFRLEGRQPFYFPLESFALDSAGNIYGTIYHGSVASIAIYSSITGKLLRTVGPLGGRLEEYGPDLRGIAVAADGTIFAVSTTGILVFSAQGTLIRTLKARSRYGICLDGQGNLYAACGEIRDGFRNLDQSGHSKQVVRVPGVTVAVDQAGNIYTAGSDLQGITVYDAQGRKQRSFGSYDRSGEMEGHLTKPPSIAIDSKGNIAVADTEQGRVQGFDPRGNVIMVLGWVKRDKGPTAVPGLFAGPTAVAFDADDNLYVLDNGHRVQVFSPDVLSGLL
jgi:sugar lactone lactonase YvrE